jgi:hypothetical protein
LMGTKLNLVRLSHPYFDGRTTPYTGTHTDCLITMLLKNSLT